MKPPSFKQIFKIRHVGLNLTDASLKIAFALNFKLLFNNFPNLSVMIAFNTQFASC